MRLKKIISAVLAAVISLHGFSAAVYAAEESQQPVYTPYDAERLDRLCDAFYSECLKPENEQAIAEAYISMTEEYDYVGDAGTLAMIWYNLIPDENSFSEYSSASVLQADSVIKILNVLQKAYRETDYKELIGYLSGMDDQTSQMEFEGDDQSVKLSYINRYYDIKQDSSLTDYEREYRTAQLYIEYAESLNSITRSAGYEDAQDYFYGSYNRDYTFKDVENLSRSVKSNTAGYYNYVMNEYWKGGNIPEKADSLVFDNNVDTLASFAWWVSDEAGESARLLRDEKLYYQGGPGSVDLAYTTFLFGRKVPVIYQYVQNINSDFGTLVHEFGHFNAMNHPSEYVNYIEVSGDCIDIAEVQSTGMSVLFTDHYSSIYGRYARPMEFHVLYNLLHTLASAFMVNEMERFVFEDPESLTPEQVLEKYDELREEYGIISFSLSDINHIFEMPFYYISYGMSAIAAFELWDEMKRDRDHAAEIYRNISHVNIYDVQNTFADSLRKSGFTADIFDAETVNEIVGDVVGYVAGRMIYGDIDENGSVTGTDIIALEARVLSPVAVTDERELKKCDLDRSGHVDSADIVRLKNLILNS